MFLRFLGWGAPLNPPVKIYNSVLHNYGVFIVYYRDQTSVPINICWTHKAYKPILDALSLYSLLDHLPSLLQTLQTQIRLL